MEAQEEIGWVNFILGRWTTKWLVVQKNYYSWLDIRNSPKRWVIAIIHKLLMITWNLWDFRNGFIHSPSGPVARLEHQTLNSQIDAQWDQGYDDLFESDKYLFTNRTQEEIRKLAKEAKQQWLKDVELAREQEEPLENQLPMVQLQRTLHNWLIHH